MIYLGIYRKILLLPWAWLYAIPNYYELPVNLDIVSLAHWWVSQVNHLFILTTRKPIMPATITPKGKAGLSLISI